VTRIPLFRNEFDNLLQLSRWESRVNHLPKFW